jgi:Flp pilus assembly pilin Flp
VHGSSILKKEDKNILNFKKFTLEHGISLMEYALMAALISAVVIVAVTAVGTQANNRFIDTTDLSKRQKSSVLFKNNLNCY